MYYYYTLHWPIDVWSSATQDRFATTYSLANVFVQFEISSLFFWFIQLDTLVDWAKGNNSIDSPYFSLSNGTVALVLRRVLCILRWWKWGGWDEKWGGCLDFWWKGGAPLLRAEPGCTGWRPPPPPPPFCPWQFSFSRPADWNRFFFSSSCSIKITCGGR